MIFHSDRIITKEQYHSNDSMQARVNTFQSLFSDSSSLNWQVNMKLSLSLSRYQHLLVLPLTSFLTCSHTDELFWDWSSLRKHFKEKTQTKTPCIVSISLPSCPQSLSVFSMSESPRWISIGSQANLRRFCSSIFIHFWIWWDLTQWFHLFCKWGDIVRMSWNNNLYWALLWKNFDQLIWI